MKHNKQSSGLGNYNIKPIYTNRQVGSNYNSNASHNFINANGK
jgi:hypothetical protein